ncbi:hypothetical protein PtB15_15B282 [Puccinia triticina]|nr:hypothetical protein PtB15_15B282 [Puccinia triticina]
MRTGINHLVVALTLIINCSATKYLLDDFLPTPSPNDYSANVQRYHEQHPTVPLSVSKSQASDCGSVDAFFPPVQPAENHPISDFVKQRSTQRQSELDQMHYEFGQRHSGANQMQHKINSHTFNPQTAPEIPLVPARMEMSSKEELRRNLKRIHFDLVSAPSMSSPSSKFSLSGYTPGCSVFEDWWAHHVTRTIRSGYLVPYVVPPPTSTDDGTIGQSCPSNSLVSSVTSRSINPANQGAMLETSTTMPSLNPIPQHMAPANLFASGGNPTQSRFSTPVYPSSTWRSKNVVTDTAMFNSDDPRMPPPSFRVPRKFMINGQKDSASEDGIIQKKSK